MAFLLGGLAFGLLLFSLLPYSVNIQRQNELTRVSFAVAGLRLPWKATEAAAACQRPASKRRPPDRRGPSARKVKALVFSRDFVPSLTRLVRRIMKEVRPRHLRVHLRFGLGDPFDTARLWGVLTPLFLYLSSLEAEEVRFEPNFLERSFRLDFSTEIRIVPAVLLVLMVGYLLTRAPWRGLLCFVRA